MGFEFEYESRDERSGPSPNPPGRRGGPPDPWWRFRRSWGRLSRSGRAAVVVVVVLAVSTIITGRDRGSDESSVEQAASFGSVVATDTTPPTTVLPAPSSTAPAVTTQAVAGTATSPTQPEPPPASAPAPTAGPSASTVDWAELSLSVVYIEADDCPSSPGLYSSGSGTVVLDGAYVLTNAHVVLDEQGRPCRDIMVWTSSSFEEEPSDWVEANLAGADRALDLAILELGYPIPAERSVSVTAQRLVPGEAIRILGFPGVGGVTMTLTRGVYSGMVDLGAERYIKTDADISEGSSGGAAFDEAGVFVGVPTAGVEQVGLLIPSGVAEQFLEALRV